MFRHFFETERPFQHARVFRKGDIKYVILDLLRDKPSHGYEIIRALEERFRGFYSPSAGSVYPTLQLLEDMGYVTSTTADGKKVYSITDEGKKFLTEHEETIDRIRDHVRSWWGPRAARSHHAHHSGWWGPDFGEDFSEIFHAWGEIASLINRRARRMDREKLSKIRQIIVQARRDIETVVNEK